MNRNGQNFQNKIIKKKNYLSLQLITCHSTLYWRYAIDILNMTVDRMISETPMNGKKKSLTKPSSEKEIYRHSNILIP